MKELTSINERLNQDIYYENMTENPRVYRYQSKEEYARSKKEDRLELYFKVFAIAGFFTVGPVGVFFCDLLLNPPKPISAEFVGIEGDGVPMGDYHEVYHHEWASSGDEMLNVLGFIFAIFAGIVFVALMYCVARFLADPIMYKIDLHYGANSTVAKRLQYIVIGTVILLYVGTVVLALVYETILEDEDVWLEDSNGVYYRVDREDYEKYMNKDNNTNEGEKDQRTTKEITTETVPATTEDLSKTPVERGYPSNDLQYYIDHPNEPMPEELINELMAPDSYNPGIDYNPENYY